MGNSESVRECKEFKATPTKCLFNSENFKIYACMIDSFKYPEIKVGAYGTVTIKGDIHELNLDCEYIIKANEVQDKYGVGYQVTTIRSEKPVSLSSSKNFLLEILTYQQTETLLSAYPDIIDRILNDKPVDLNKTKGIKDATFSKIKQKVIENFKLAELVDEFSGVFSFSIMKRLYAEYTSIEKIKENLHNNPYECLCKLGGVGFQTADELLLAVDKKSKENKLKGKKPIIDFQFDLLTSVQRMKACALYILDKNETNGNTHMSIKAFQKECINYAPEAKHTLVDVIKDSNEMYFDKKYGRISKKSTYETEKYIAETLKLANNIKQIWDIDIEKYRQIENSSLTDEQMLTMKYVCENTVTVLQGFGGTGKSFSILALMNLLNDHNKSAVLFAPTGRAARVLQRYTNHEASTIHRGLGFKPPNKWGFDKDNKLPYDMVILDETSMADVFLFKHLLQSIDFTRTKLLLIGDNAQIPSVSCGNLLHDILNSGVIPTVWLTKVFRYGKGGLSTVATDVRNSKCTFKSVNGIQTIGEDKGFSFVSVIPERTVDSVIKLYQSLLAKGTDLKDILIVIAQNKGQYGTQTVNSQIQDVINPNASDKLIYGNTEFRLGDPVIQCVNDYKSQIYTEDTNFDLEEGNVLITNGDIGIITKILTGGLVVKFDDYLIYIPKDKLGNIKLAYAISIHKSQGGQAKYVIVIAPNSHTFMLNSNLLYVGITRAREKCFLFGDLVTYNRAIKKKENFARQTWLCDLLQGT